MDKNNKLSTGEKNTIILKNIAYIAKHYEAINAFLNTTKNGSTADTLKPAIIGNLLSVLVEVKDLQKIKIVCEKIIEASDKGIQMGKLSYIAITYLSAIEAILTKKVF